MSTGSPIADGVLGAFGAFLVTWAVAFVVRFLNAPVILYHEQKERADGLEGLRQIADEASRPPSFDLGFEFIELEQEPEGTDDFEKIHRSLRSKDICRIWIENLENQPIVDCRVILEDFHPRHSAVTPGAMLTTVDAETDSRFILAATEKRFFKFIEANSAIRIVTNLNRLPKNSGFSARAMKLRTPTLEIGTRYFATIAVHGNNAKSRRMNLIIDLTDANHVFVAESSAEQQEMVTAS